MGQEVINIIYTVLIVFSYYLGRRNKGQEYEEKCRLHFLNNIARHKSIVPEYRADNIRDQLAKDCGLKEDPCNCNIWYDETGQRFTLTKYGFKIIIDY